MPLFIDKFKRLLVICSLLEVAHLSAADQFALGSLARFAECRGKYWISIKYLNILTDSDRFVNEADYG